MLILTYLYTEQAKNIWQAEIDAAAELIDFLRFNCQYARVSHNYPTCQPMRSALTLVCIVTFLL